MTEAKVDIYGHKKIMERINNQLHKFGEDKWAVKNFLEQLTIEGLTAARVNKCAFTIITLRRLLEKDLVSAEENDIRTLVTKIEKCERSSWTKRDYRIILKRFLKFHGKEYEWLKSGNGKTKNVLPEEILTEEEIKSIAETTYTKRDRAFILSLYESGCRIGEFLPLKLKHVNFDKHGVVLRITGKTGGRRIRLVFSAMPFQTWIDEHPGKNNPESFLWTTIPSPYNPKWKNRALSYRYIIRSLRELAEKGGIKKKVNPHAFRHARATFMARHLKEPEMREFFGWGRDSEMPSIYVHLSGRDIDNSVLSIYGIKEGEKSQEPVLKIHECPRCKDPNDPAAMFCHKCGLPFKEEGIEAENKLESVVVELLNVIAEMNPTIKDKFREIVKEKGAEKIFI